jgi:GNAT superfamily N-acetyltransferase
MSVEPRIRMFQRSDEGDAIRMLLEKLPPSEREGAYKPRLARWQWQYYDNPNNPEGEPLIWVTTVDDRFAGMVATIPVRVRTPKGLVLGLWGVDFIVDRRMRGMGIGKKLVAAWPEPADIAFVMGWSAVSYKITVDFGFDTVLGFTTADILLSRIGYATTQVRNRERRNLNRLAKVFWRSNPHPHGDGRPGLTIETALPEETGELWNRVCPAYPFAVERDETYLRWRFERHPSYTYHYVCLRDSDELVGLAVCRLTAEKPPLGVVADLIVDPNCRDLVSDLVDGAIEFLKSGGAYAARMDLPPCLADQILARYRCSLTKDRGMILYYRDQDLKAAGILDPQAWYISRSDADEDY